jgi:hypothetical protein
MRSEVCVYLKFDGQEFVAALESGLCLTSNGAQIAGLTRPCFRLSSLRRQRFSTHLGPSPRIANCAGHCPRQEHRQRARPLRPHGLFPLSRLGGEQLDGSHQAYGRGDYERDGG